MAISEKIQAKLTRFRDGSLVSTHPVHAFLHAWLVVIERVERSAPLDVRQSIKETSDVVRCLLKLYKDTEKAPGEEARERVWREFLKTAGIKPAFDFASILKFVGAMVQISKPGTIFGGYIRSNRGTFSANIVGTELLKSFQPDVVVKALEALTSHNVDDLTTQLNVMSPGAQQFVVNTFLREKTKK